MKDKYKMKPCPFCGDPLPDIARGNPSNIYYGHCDDCGAHGPWKFSVKGAIAAWNRREPDWQAKWEGLVETVAQRTDQAKGAK